MVMEYQVIYHLQRSYEISNWTEENVYSGYSILLEQSEPLVEEVC